MEKNKKFINELLAIFSKVSFGSINLDTEVHRGEVVLAKFKGWKKLKYRLNNEEAMKDLLKRIKSSLDRKENTKLFFMVDVKNGVIQQITWNIDFLRTY